MVDVIEHDDNSLDWINVQLFESILEKDLNLNSSDFSIKIKSIKPAVGNGENYIATVTRVQIEVTTKSDKNVEPKPYSFIVKCVRDVNEGDDWGVLEKELLFYSDIVPKLKELNSSEQYIPKSYFVPKELQEKYKTVVVEDLSPYGYKMLNRLEGLDLEHCKVFYKQLGGYHALTAAYYEKHGTFGPKFHRSNYPREMTRFHSSFIKLLFPNFIEVFSKYDTLKPYYERVKNWGDEILSHVQDVTESKPDVFNVLCHGDSWTNNILYLHDANGKPKDLIFVDHQLTVFGSPGLDLVFFIITSPTTSVRDHNFDELVRIYHDSLVENLAKHNYSKPIPTLRELHMDILNWGPFACFLAIGMLPLCLVANEETGPINVLLSDTEMGKTIRHNMFNSQRYLTALESVLKFLEKRGMLTQ